MTGEIRKVISLVESGWHQLPVVVVGDVMLDQYVWGEVERISPEAPVPVVRTVLRDEKPGGAANVAMNLAALGACVTLVGFAGGDREQDSLESLLAQEGIEPRLVAVPAHPTTSKLRVLCGHQQIMRLDSESTDGFRTCDYERILAQSLSVLPQATVVILSDYAKGSLSESVCRRLIVDARLRDIPVLVDPKCNDFSRYRDATVICPNLKELSAATGEPASDVRAVLDAGQSMVKSLGLQFMAVTLGAKGIAVLRPDLRFHAPAVVRHVYDVSGAGDTVIAVLALAMASGVAVETAVEIANAAAGIVVGKVGTAAITRDELLGALSQRLEVHPDEKVVPLDRLRSRMALWRAAGQRIVFTNGCFDILHIGHIRLLEEARRKGDRLIVGLNSDTSVRQLKGPARPIVPAVERARVLAAMSAVDAVVVFDESTPLQLLLGLRPDILVKGGDYTEDAVVGAREVRAWGGRVELVPLVPEASTTRLIAKSVARVPAQPSSAAVSA